jgi:Fe2+ transport system protein FeoA
MTVISATPIPLSDVQVGDHARFHASQLDGGTTQFLRAIGLTPSSEIRVCKSGEPCIVQVRSTRIGLSRRVADGILVVPCEGC